MSETEKAIERIKEDLERYDRNLGIFGIAVMLCILAVVLARVAFAL